LSLVIENNLEKTGKRSKSFSKNENTRSTAESSDENLPVSYLIGEIGATNPCYDC
jgi:hypothetical protein